MPTPRVCSLPDEERPLRLAEFESLFADRLERVVWPDNRSAVFRLAGGDELAERARDLAERESRCCSFFSFAVDQPAVGVVTLRVQVPRRYRNVLKAMVDGATAVAP
jgi:hypothetical protein